MNQLAILFKKSLSMPILVLTILTDWLDVLKVASDTGREAVLNELAQVNEAATIRAEALTSQAAELKAARQQRSKASVKQKVTDIQSEFK